MTFFYLEPDEEDFPLYIKFMKKFGNGGFYWATADQLCWRGPGESPDWYNNQAETHAKTFDWGRNYDR